MTTIQELQTIQQALVASIRDRDLYRALQIINWTGVTLETSVCGVTANIILGKETNDSLREFCQEHVELDFDILDYLRGVGMSGNTTYAEELIMQQDADVEAIAAGAAFRGDRGYCEQLRTQYGGSGVAHESARYAARGGYRDYAEELRTQHNADVHWIAQGAALGGHLEYAEMLRTQYDASATDIAQGAAHGGYLEYAEVLRTQHGAELNDVAEAAAQGGHREYAEKLRIEHEADTNWIAYGAANGCHRDYAEYLRTVHDADLDTLCEHARGQYRYFLQNIINQSPASAQASLNGPSRSSNTPGFFSATAPGAPQPSSAGEEKVESVADYSGLILINLPTNAETLTRFESQLESTLGIPLICPITYAVFRQPVIAADGVTYEYNAIKTHIEMQLNERREITSPTTNVPLSHIGLVPNKIVAQLINAALTDFNASQINDEEHETQDIGAPTMKRARLI